MYANGLLYVIKNFDFFSFLKHFFIVVDVVPFKITNLFIVHITSVKRKSNVFGFLLYDKLLQTTSIQYTLML